MTRQSILEALIMFIWKNLPEYILVLKDKLCSLSYKEGCLKFKSQSYAFISSAVCKLSRGKYTYKVHYCNISMYFVA